MASSHSPRTPAWPPKSAPRLFVEQTLELSALVAIDGNQAHYLARVMRVSPGDAIILCDNRTGEWIAKVIDVQKRQVTAEIFKKAREREPTPDVWLCPALLKKDRFDLVLEKATELGVAALKPVVTRRCVADKLNLDRARAVAIEAAEQCARTSLPDITAPTKIDALLREWPSERMLFFADEEGGEPAHASFASQSGPSAILIGPEGGFDDAERAAIRAHPQARPISLGPRILRGETAAIAALSVWMAVSGDWSKQE